MKVMHRRLQLPSIVPLLAPLALLPLLALAACDPCAGVVNCTPAPQLSLSGQIVDQADGQPVRGVAVSVVRTGGVALEQDSVATTTDARGNWHLQSRAVSSGDVTVDILVEPPGLPPYRVTAQSFRTGGRESDYILPPWVSRPFFPVFGELALAGTGDERVQFTAATFHRTSGVELLESGTSVNDFTGSTDSAGRIALFWGYLQSRGLGEVVGDLEVHLPPPAPAALVPNIHLQATQLLHPEPLVLRWELGPASLPYYAAVKLHGQAAPGVQVDVQRVGGVDVTPASFTRTTNAAGQIFFDVTPDSVGAVSFDVTIHSPAPYAPVVIHGLSLEATSVAGTQLVAVWDIDLMQP